jgi:hypothetical protein
VSRDVEREELMRRRYRATIDASDAGEEARSLLQQGRSAEAVLLLRAKLERALGTAGDHMLLGIALARSGDRSVAMEALERAVRWTPRMRCRATILARCTVRRVATGRHRWSFSAPFD